MGSDASFCLRRVSAEILSCLRASTAEAMSSALEEDCFLSSRTREPCLVILALRASISSWRLEDDMVAFMLSSMVSVGLRGCLGGNGENVVVPYRREIIISIGWSRSFWRS